MAMKGYSAFSKGTALLKPQHLMDLCHIQDIRLGRGFNPLQTSCPCILLHQPTGQIKLFLLRPVTGSHYCLLWLLLINWNHIRGWTHRGVMAKVLDWGLNVSMFKLQQCHYVHCRTIILGKGINSLILQLMV